MRSVAELFIRLSRFAFVVALVGVVACGGGGDGSVHLSVSMSALSDDAARVASVVVTADNGTTQVQTTLTMVPSNANKWTGTLGGIPAGDGWVFTGIAYDSTNNALFEGATMAVTIYAGQTAIVVLELTPIDPPPSYGNHAPHINSLFVSSDAVAPQDSIHLAVSATDADGDPLTYVWSDTPHGTFTTPAQPETNWSATNDGTYDLTIKVTDNHQAFDAITVAIAVNESNDEGAADITVNINAFPEIHVLTLSTGNLEVGVPAAAAVVATDSDGDTLTYTWSTDCDATWSLVTTTDPTASSTLTVPAGSTATACAIHVDVDDGKGGTTFGELVVAVGPPPAVVSFAAKEDVLVGGSPVGLGIGDLDGDGAPDVVTASDTGDVSILMNATAAGVEGASFAPVVHRTVGADLTGLVLVDLDGDGALEIVLSETTVVAGSPRCSVHALMNQSTLGAPAFSAPLRFDMGGTHCDKIAAADIDGDGKPDLLLVDTSEGNVYVLQNATAASGNASFVAVQAATGLGPVPGIGVADFDQDGDPDILLPSGDQVGFLENTSTAGAIGFALLSWSSAGLTVNAVAAHDVDGDGWPDAILASSDGMVSVLHNAEMTGGSFALLPGDVLEGLATTGQKFVQVADLNGDALPDLLFADASANTVSIFTHSAVPTKLAFAHAVDLQVGTTPRALAIGDLGRTGRPDIITADYAAGAVSVLINLAP